MNGSPRSVASLIIGSYTNCRCSRSGRNIGDNAPLKEIEASGFFKTLGIGHF
jgi:hypothetical protein